MRRLVIGLALCLATLPVMAAVAAGPQPAIGLGVPAALAMALVSLIAFAIERRKV